MRVLLDENIDRLLKRLFLAEFDVVTTVRERGRDGKRNGELLRAAEQEFDGFVTMDCNLEHQQNLRASKLGIVVIRAYGNAHSVVAALMPEVDAALRSIRPGELPHVSA